MTDRDPLALAARVRRAAPADARAIAEIRVASWRATYDGIVPRGVLDGLDVARNEAWLGGRLADPGPTDAFVIEDAGRVVGYALLAPSRDPDAPGLGEVEAIYVSPAVIGRGFGRALMDVALEGLAGDGHPAAILWVLTANHPARRFYERAGFTHDGAARMLDFDGTPIEEIRYRRPIG